MKYRYTLQSQARLDFKDAKAWYASRKVRGLSGRFNAAVLGAIERILSNPFAFAIRYRNVRFCQTETFPYVLHFVVDDATMLVTITGILYTGREPAVGQGRVAE